MVLAADVVVVEGEDIIGRAGQVVAANAVSRIALLVDGRERSGVVPQDPDRPRPGAIEREVVFFAAAVVVEGEDTIGRAGQVVVANAVPGSPCW